jgi:tetratricopeptide (TPR) repeat protein
LKPEQLGRLLSIGSNGGKSVEAKAKDMTGKKESSPSKNHPPEDQESSLSAAGPQIEGYEILGKLGEAGQGQIWRALQVSMSREVALKVPRTGMINSEKILARFEREIEVAARLRHPNIARIHDSGIHHGIYYYTMDLVEGVHLDQYVKEHNLTIRQILELMRIICQAVQYAHQNGVIHRDLKPSNIIVADDGEPFIVDFGLAKNLLEGDLNITVSGDGEIPGTPAYMSPEQAAGHTDKLDTRSDVYSLGVILFTLLTDESPHDLSGTRYEVMRRISDEHVMRPRKICPTIDKDLELLLLKALDNDPDRRYVSGGELAQDIENYLTGAPLIAGPPTTFYRFKKFVRRHAMFSVAVIAVGATLIIGLAAITAMYFRAENALGEATAISDFLVKDILSDQNLLEEQELDTEYLLDNATEKLEGKFENQPLIEARIRTTLGQRYLNINKPELAREHLERAYQIYLQYYGPKHPGTVKTVNLICWIDFQEGRYDKAIQQWTEQIEITRTGNGELKGLGMMFMMNIGQTYVYLDKHKEAEEWLDKTLELCERSKSTRMPYVRRMARIHQGQNYTDQGRYDEAEQIYLKVLQEKPDSKNVKVLGCKTALSMVYRLKGQHEKAQQLCEATLSTMRQELGEAHSETLRAKCCLGQIFMDKGFFDEAERLIKDALEGQQLKLGDDHPHTLRTIHELAVLYKEQARYEEAEELFIKVVDGRRLKLGDTHPHTLGSWKNLIEFYEAWGKPEKAEEWREKLAQIEDFEE